MMRALAFAALRLYPKAWRARYGEEVRDLIESRPARPRTVIDLVMGALDARLRQPLPPGLAPVLLPVAGLALTFLWNPAFRQMDSLNGVWAAAGAPAEALAAVASAMFALAPAVAVASLLLLIAGSARSARQGGLGLALVLGTVIGLPIGLVCYVFYGMAYFDLGFPIGPLGSAMTGCFFAPVIPAFVLGYVGMVDRRQDVGLPTRILAVAAGLNAVAWLPVVALVALGGSGAAAGWVAVVAAAMVCSLGMSALTLWRALRPPQAVKAVAR